MIYMRQQTQSTHRVATAITSIVNRSRPKGILAHTYVCSGETVQAVMLLSQFRMTDSYSQSKALMSSAC
jgi:hypothetical protein